MEGLDEYANEVDEEVLIPNEYGYHFYNEEEVEPMEYSYMNAASTSEAGSSCSPQVRERKYVNGGSNQEDKLSHEVNRNEIEDQDDNLVEAVANGMQPEDAVVIIEEEEGDYDDQQSLNPFLIPEIVSNVLRFVEPKVTIINCRSVSRLWKSEATKLIRKRHTVQLYTVKQIWEYHSVMHLSQDLPHEIFNFNFLVTELDNFGAMTLNSFITTFGPNIKHLKLSLNDKFSSPNDWWTLLYNCSNLEKLSVCIYPEFTTSFGPGDGGITLFQIGRRRLGFGFGSLSDYRHLQLAQRRNEIFRGAIGDEFDPSPIGVEFDPSLPLYGPIAPRLQLKIQHFFVKFERTCGNSEIITDFFKAIFRECVSSLRSISCSSFHTEIYLGNILYNSLVSTVIESDLVYQNLRELNFWFKPNNEQLKDLNRFSQLTRLNLVLGSDIRNDTLQKAFVSSASTIQRLQLVIQAPTSLKGALAVPVCMKRLKQLKLVGHNGSLKFLLNAPALEELHVFGMKLKLLTEELARHRLHPALKYVKVSRSDGFVDVRAVSGITDSFHEIVSLELRNTTNAALDMIYQSMPNLRDLKITGTFTDEGICGIPAQTCEEIEELQAHFIADDTKLRQYVFIGCLSKLKRLSIKSNLMTDISVMFGITKLQNLEELVIAGDLITERAAEAICNFMVLNSVDITGCQNVTEEVLSRISTQSSGKDLVYRKTPVDYTDEYIDQLLAFDHGHMIHVQRQRNIEGPANINHIPPFPVDVHLMEVDDLFEGFLGYPGLGVMFPHPNLHNIWNP